jgi:hypothetical protein
VLSLHRAVCLLLQMLAADASERVSVMSSSVCEQQKQLSGELQGVSVSVAEEAKKLADWSLTHHQQLSRRAAQLTSFLQEELQKDIPTGEVTMQDVEVRIFIPLSHCVMKEYPQAVSIQ